MKSMASACSTLVPPSPSSSLLVAKTQEGHGFVGRFTGLTFPVEDIQSKYRQLSAAGVEFTGDPERQYWGGWLATFQTRRVMVFNSCSIRPNKLLQATRETRAPERRRQAS